MNKGAMIFHMIRAMMGDTPFKMALRDFYFQFAEKSARIEDFEAIADRRAQAATKPGQEPPNLRSFFTQWLNSTGVPEFAIEFVVYRTPKGFRVNGKIKQPLDTFHMPLELRIDTEGNPETKTVDVVGTETTFSVETFGRPKPGGIKIDPNNVLLKGSASLRARAAIARGEELAEQNISARFPSSPVAPLQTSAWAKRSFIRKIIKRLPTPSGKRSRLSRSPLRSGPKFGGTSIWGKFLTCLRSASAP
jgi:hypothetical protein